jgi:hypothetical protein
MNDQFPMTNAETPMTSAGLISGVGHWDLVIGHSPAILVSSFKISG